MLYYNIIIHHPLGICDGGKSGGLYILKQTCNSQDPATSVSAEPLFQLGLGKQKFFDPLYNDLLKFV